MRIVASCADDKTIKLWRLSGNKHWEMYTMKGHGNNGRDGLEGVRQLNAFGTYLHGPLLPKNVALADRLISLALGKDGTEHELEPLEDSLEAQAHETARRVALS